MWNVRGKPMESILFGSLEPVEVLIDLDGPRTFTFHDRDNGLCLAHWLDEDTEIARFIVVPFSELLLNKLQRGELTVREALDQPRVYVADVEHAGEVRSIWMTRLADLPSEGLPKPGTMLFSSLEPFFSLRAIGQPIQAGHIPGSVIKFAVESAQKAIKVLAEHELNVQQQLGRPLRALKRLYDLPAQALRAASFEIVFRSPLSESDLFEGLSASEVQEETAVLDRVGLLMQAGLEWLRSGQTGSLPIPNDLESSRVIVRALKHLTPSSHGPIREIELRGGLVHATFPVRLTRDSRTIVNATLRRFPTPSERSVRLVGRVGALDADFLRFELRDIEGNTPNRACIFDEDLWDDVHDLLGEEVRVEVMGVETSSTSPVRVAFLVRLPER